MRTTVVVCALLVWCAVGALADPINVIHQRNPNLVEPTNYVISQVQQAVTIYLGVEGETFQFDALLEEEGQLPRLGSIAGGIFAQANAGPVAISVKGHDPVHEPPYSPSGASVIGKIDLGAEGVQGVLEDVSTEYLGTTGDVVANRLPGNISVTVDMLGDFDIGWLDGGVILCNGEVQDIRIGCRTGGSASHNGTVYCGLFSAGRPYSGHMEICGELLQSTILLNAGLAAEGSVHITGDFTGLFDVPGLYLDEDPEQPSPLLDGVVTIDGNLETLFVGEGLAAEDRPASTGTVQVLGQLVGIKRIIYYGPLAGTIQLDENEVLTPPRWLINVDSMQASASALFPHTMSGNLIIQHDMGGHIVADTMSGEVRIKGSLLDNPNEDYEVEIDSMASSAAVVADSDGWDQGDSWESGAVVNVAGVPYLTARNAPGIPLLYDVTCEKGDLDNSGATNNQDIDPFLTALFGGPDAYDSAYPGLRGSMLYHGDFDGSGAISNQDIDGFLACLFGSCPCVVQGGGVGGGTGDSAGQGGQGEGDSAIDPGNAAAVLQAYTPPQYQADLVAAAADLASNGPNEEFWTAVLEALE